jgi:nucleoside-diphosphate-sugar epimerase
VREDRRLRPEKSEVERLLGSNEKVRRLTGWAPRVGLDEGLDRTVAWFKGPGVLAKYKPLLYNV